MAGKMLPRSCLCLKKMAVALKNTTKSQAQFDEVQRINAKVDYISNFDTSKFFKYYSYI